MEQFLLTAPSCSQLAGGPSRPEGLVSVSLSLLSKAALRGSKLTHFRKHLCSVKVSSWLQIASLSLPEEH